MATTLSEYYQSIGKSLPSFSSRFSDPAFAAAAQRAGISQSAYTGSAAQNTAILNALKTSTASTAPKTTTTTSTAPKTTTTTSIAPKTTTSTTSTAPKTTTTSTGPSQALRDLSIGMANGTITSQSQVTQTSTAPKTTTTAPTTSPTSSSASNVYASGDYGLIRISGQGPNGWMDEGTIWLVDNSNKTLRPFSGSAALRNFFDGDVNVDQIPVVPATDFNPGGRFGSMGSNSGFQILSNEYAIQRDGSARRLEYSNSQLATRYGQPVNMEMEQTMFSALKGILSMLETAGVDKGTIDSIRKNDAQMAFYVSALAYGGYSIGDIYSDAKKRELGISNISPISATADKASYARTSDYQKAASDSRIMPPVEMAGMNRDMMDLPVYQLPDEAFKTLVPILNYESQEFKDAMAQVETSYYDLLEQQLRASTEQEKAVADYNYNEWKNEVQRNFGIALSDNALEAWNQIQGIYNQGAQANIFNSGIQNESIDTYLRRVRQQDARIRDEKLSNEERQEMNYYLTAATPQQIKELIDNNPDKARSWGLIPSDEVKNALSLSALKEKYPNAKEEDLAQYISILLDENGNYRSQIYQKQMGTLMDLNPGSASLGNLTGLQTAKEQFQYGEALRKELLKEEEAYKTFTTPDSPFLRFNDPNAFSSVAGVNQSSGKTDNLSSIIKQAGAGLGLGGGTPTGSATTPTPTTPSGSSGTQPTQSQLSTWTKQLQDAQNTLNAIQNRPTTSTPTYTPAPVATTPTKTGPSDALRNLSISNTPVQGPVQQKPTQINNTPSFNTAHSTPAVANTTSGGTVGSIWNKLKSFF